MKNIFLLLLGILVNTTSGQIFIQYLNDVPASFKEEYYSKPRNYNSLQVGNIWQYYDSEYDVYSSIKVLQDSVINGKKYFKKLYYPEFTTNPNSNISWERNDTISGVSFMLDFQDVNDNGDSLEELPLDSLENPYWSIYKSFKYSFPHSNFSTPGEKEVLVKDTSWISIEGDTVISRYFEFTYGLFWSEEIADKFGIIFHSSESPNRWLIGAVINGKRYGNIVNVKNNVTNFTNNIYLSQNYPNPFNPVTTIHYSVPNLGSSFSFRNVKLIVYDALGKKVKTLVNKAHKPGNYIVTFDGTNLASGIYYYSLITNKDTITKSMILIK
jgi:hypothetical protein